MNKRVIIYSVGDVVKYHDTICEVVKVAYGSAWWCLEDREENPRHYKQFVKIVGLYEEFENCCTTEHVRPYMSFAHKVLSIHELT